MTKVLFCLFYFFFLPSTVSCITHRALVIGLGTQKDSRWGKIHGDKDVYYVEKFLRKAGYQDIYTLKNEDATKKAIVDAFKTLVTRCQKGDVVYVHYSGHGQLMTDIDGDEAEKWKGTRHAQCDEAWIPYDAYIEYCANDRGEKHLCDDEIAQMLSKIRKKIGDKGEIIVVVDACHSGDATRGMENECVRGIDVRFNIPKKVNETISYTPIKDEWLTVSACKPFQLCTEIKNLNIGKLTYAIYTIGNRFFTLSNEDLQRKLATIMDMNKGRLPQNPMVSGKKRK